MAGLLRSYLERMLGLPYMAAQACMRLWFIISFGAGLFFALGVVTFLYDLSKVGTEALSGQEG